MSELLSQLTYWHWWGLALLLVILEMVMPGFFLLWIGIAAAITGLLLLVVPTTPWQVQFVVFGVLAIGAIVAARYYIRHNPIQSDDRTLNRRGEQYVGRVFTIDEAIINGIGKVRVGDSVWRAAGPDLPAGERVKVVGVDGTMLKVEKA